MSDDGNLPQTRHGVGLLDGRRAVTEELLFKLLHLMASRGLLSYDDLQTLFASSPGEIPQDKRQSDPYVGGLATGRDVQSKHLQEELLPRLIALLPAQQGRKADT